MTRPPELDVTQPKLQPPDVTIVIPLFNGERFVVETLESVLEQTYENFEVVVLDDGSTDDGPVRAAEIPDPRVQVVSQRNRGVASARNDGAALASPRSGYLVFLDADDRWHPQTLEVLVDAIERRPDAAGAFVLADYVDSQGRPFQEGHFAAHMRIRPELRRGRLVARDVEADLGIDQLFISNPVYPPSCAIVRRTAFDTVGGFDGRFLAEDWEFMTRLVATGPLVPIDRVLVGYRRHDANASGVRSRNVRGARQVWAAVYHAPGRSHASRTRLRAIWRAHQRRAASRKLSEAGALLRRGQFPSAFARSIDGLAHGLLCHPPSFWLPPEILKRTSVKDRS